MAVCPLCGAPPVATVAEVVLGEVWAAYERQHGARFSAALIARYGRGPVLLRGCGGCGLEWFDPPLEGDADFYAQLATRAARYYEPWRWEFDQAAARVPDGARLVEVGAGDGAFVRAVRRRCGSVEVIDKNPAAAAALRTAGIEVRDADVRAAAATRPGRADVVCAFQVLEHVADVRGFAAALAALAVPGGEVLVSVPNRDRLVDGHGPMDCPPHHLSRWRTPQLAALARVVGLELVDVRYEPPPLSHTRAVRKQPVADALRPMVGARWSERLGFWSARLRMPERRYDRLVAAGGFPARRQYGHTMLAVLRRPG